MKRTSLEITLRDDLIQRMDQMIDGTGIKDYSEAVEILISKSLNARDVKTAFILVGGKGTRMRPITYEIPKSLIPIQGQPLLEHLIDLLRKYEIRDLILSIGHMGDRIKEYFGNGSKFGVKIRYVEEKTELGTAGPLLLAKDLLKDNFLMFNGDVLADIDLYDFITFHRENGGVASVALTPVDDPSGFGVAKLKGNKIFEFIEKPKKGTEPSNLINAGVYICRPEILDYIPEGRAMIETDVFPKLAEEGKLYGFKFEKQWFDTGTHEAYERAIHEWKGVD